MDDNWELVRLSLGAFLVSPGAGVLGLIGAGLLTYVGVGKRLRGDRQLAQEAREAEHQKDREDDARERWQRFYDHLWENRAILPADAIILGVRYLAEAVETQEQSALLEVFLAYVAVQAEETAEQAEETTEQAEETTEEGEVL